MDSARAGSLVGYLSLVPDPRGRNGRRHPLKAMLTAAVCGFLCGCRGWKGLAEWLDDLPLDVCHWMGFTRWPPKQDCFRDLFLRLDPVEFEHAIRAWMTECLGLDSEESLRAVSFDGKTLRGSARQYASAVHLLAAVDHENGCVLSQTRVPDTTNEHKTAFELLRNLVLKDTVIVGDAAFCQRDLSETIVAEGGDYFFSVKENQPGLLQAISHEFAALPAAFSPLRSASA